MNSFENSHRLVVTYEDKDDYNFIKALLPVALIYEGPMTDIRLSDVHVVHVCCDSEGKYLDWVHQIDANDDLRSMRFPLSPGSSDDVYWQIPPLGETNTRRTV